MFTVEISQRNGSVNANVGGDGRVDTLSCRTGNVLSSFLVPMDSGMTNQRRYMAFSLAHFPLFH